MGGRGVRSTSPVEVAGRLAVLPLQLATTWFADVVAQCRSCATHEAGREAVGFRFQHSFDFETIVFKPFFKARTEVHVIEVEFDTMTFVFEGVLVELVVITEVIVPVVVVSRKTIRPVFLEALREQLTLPVFLELVSESDRLEEEGVVRFRFEPSHLELMLVVSAFALMLRFIVRSFVDSQTDDLDVEGRDSGGAFFAEEILPHVLTIGPEVTQLREFLAIAEPMVAAALASPLAIDAELGLFLAAIAARPEIGTVPLVLGLRVRQTTLVVIARERRHEVVGQREFALELFSSRFGMSFSRKVLRFFVRHGGVIPLLDVGILNGHTFDVEAPVPTLHQVGTTHDAEFDIPDTEQIGVAVAFTNVDHMIEAFFIERIVAGQLFNADPGAHAALFVGRFKRQERIKVEAGDVAVMAIGVEERHGAYSSNEL